MRFFNKIFRKNAFTIEEKVEHEIGRIEVIPEKNNANLVEQKEYIWVKSIWAMVIAGLVPLFGCLFVLYRGHVNLNKKVIEQYDVKKKKMVKVVMNKVQKKRANIKSYIYFLIAFSSVFYWYYIAEGRL